MRRVDSGDININNYYVCEAHFPNQILDYSTRKILIKTALPLSLAELKLMPHKAQQSLKKNNIKSDRYNSDFDDDFDEDTNDGRDIFTVSNEL